MLCLRYGRYSASYCKGSYRILFVILLPLLIELPHVYQSILHLLQSPDLLAFTFPPDLDGRFTQHSVTLRGHKQRRCGAT